jgi:hypothetical protein
MEAIRSSCRFSIGHGSARSNAASSRNSRGAMHPPGHQKIALYSGCNAIAPAHQPRRRPQLRPAHGQIPIAEPATPPSTCPSQWFRPWRFSDAGRGVCGNARGGERERPQGRSSRAHSWPLLVHPLPGSSAGAVVSSANGLVDLFERPGAAHPLAGAPSRRSAPFACVITQARGLPRRVDRISLRSAT